MFSRLSDITGSWDLASLIGHNFFFSQKMGYLMQCSFFPPENLLRDIEMDVNVCKSITEYGNEEVVANGEAYIKHASENKHNSSRIPIQHL